MMNIHTTASSRFPRLSNYQKNMVAGDRQYSFVDSQFQSCFVSYGRSDCDFASKLTASLRERGVSVFFFPDTAIPGMSISDTMRNGIHDCKRMILVCSEKSLNRPGVQFEIKECLAREAREGGANILVPITLDSYVFDHWGEADLILRRAVLSRVIADFRGTQNCQSKFTVKIENLLAAIQTYS